MRDIKFTIEVDNISGSEFGNMNDRLHNIEHIGHTIGEYECLSKAFTFYPKNKLIDENEYGMLIKALMKLSELFPSATFKVNLNNRTTNGLWIDYYHNGTIESCYAKVVYPEPKNVSWTHTWTYQEEYTLKHGKL